MGVPQMDGLYRKKPMKMDDLGVPLFSKTSIYTVRLPQVNVYWIIKPIIYDVH